MPKEVKGPLVSVIYGWPNTQVCSQKCSWGTMGDTKQATDAAIYLGINNSVGSVLKAGRVKKLEKDDLVNASNDRLGGKEQVTAAAAESGVKGSSKLRYRLTLDGDVGAIVALRLWSTKDVKAKIGLMAYPLQMSPFKGDNRQITGWSRVTTATNQSHEHTLGDGEFKATGLGPGIDQVDCTSELGRRVGQKEDVIRKHE